MEKYYNQEEVMLRIHSGIKITKAVPKVLVKNTKYKDEYKDGYQVVFKDGYKNWIPKNIFEKHYGKICDSYVDFLKLELKNIRKQRAKMSEYISVHKSNNIIHINKKLFFIIIYRMYLINKIVISLSKRISHEKLRKKNVTKK